MAQELKQKQSTVPLWRYALTLFVLCELPVLLAFCFMARFYGSFKKFTLAEVAFVATLPFSNPVLMAIDPRSWLGLASAGLGFAWAALLVFSACKFRTESWRQLSYLLFFASFSLTSFIFVSVYE